MALTQLTVYELHCDGDDCTNRYIDADSEQPIIHEDPVTLTAWAQQTGWINYQGRLLCDDECAIAVAHRPHEYTARSGDDAFCAICKQWTDNPLHTNVDMPLPGQFEIPRGA